MDLKRRTAKFIPTAQYSPDITALRRIRCQLASDLADYAGNSGTAVFTVRSPHSLIDLAGRKDPARMASQISKDSKLMVSQSNKLTAAGYRLLL